MADTLYSQALDTDFDVWNGYTIVMRWAASVLTLPTGTIARMRAYFEAGAAQALTVSKAYVEHKAGSGDVYDFATTPRQFLFSGSASKAITAGTTEVTDWLTFTYDKTTDLLIAFYAGGGVGSDMSRGKTGLSANIIEYYFLADEAATVNKSAGYNVTASRLQAINKIEVETASGFFFLFQ